VTASPLLLKAVSVSISGSGRPRKAGPRHPCGKLVQARPAEREADNIVVALRQPHRRDAPVPRDPHLCTLIGQLVERGEVVSKLPKNLLHDAAKRYAADYARYQRALLSRRPLAVTGGAVLRAEDADAEARAYRSACDTFAAAGRALRAAGERVEKAAHAAILDAAPETPSATLAPWIKLSLPAALAALVEHYRLGG
jgi:hypothetical protein